MSVLGSSNDPAVTTDVQATISSRLRGLVNLIAARIPALGQALRAASIPVTLASDQPAIAVDATLEVGDIQIGAVENKDADTDRRQKVDAATNITEAHYAGAVHDAVLGITTGAALDADGTGTHQQYLRGLLKAFLARIPASLGIKAAAASLSVTQATEDAARMPASLGSKADAAAFPVTFSTEDKAKVPALGVAASAASSPVVLASDDAHLGAVGAAAAVDGTLHAQQRSIGTAAEAIRATAGATTGAAVITDADGTIQQYARGLVKVLITALGSVGAASDIDGVVHAQLRYLGDQLDKLEARIAQPLLTSAPVSISIGTATARTTGLTVGTVYMISASAPCFIKVGNDTVEAATTDVFCDVGDRFVWTPSADNTDDGVACIGSVAGGKVYVQACQA